MRCISPSAFTKYTVADDDAAIQSDVPRRATARFDDPIMQSFGDGVSCLGETVERGLAETRSVMEALSACDLTGRGKGNDQCAFDELRSDVKMTADRPKEIVTEIQLATG